MRSLDNFGLLGKSSKEIDQELARRSFLDFVTYVKPNYRPAWYHKVICEYLERWAFGDITRLMLFMPVQHGKSELVSRNLPAWILGKDPEAKIITASYGAKLARKMGRAVQRAMDSDAYIEVFPKSRLFGKNVVTVAKGTWLKNSEIFEIVDHTGSYQCTGIGGGISGNPMTHGIIDDPLRGRNDAESPAIRERIQEWYDGDFWTRQSTNGDGLANARILLTVTRWNEEDLAGTLLKKAQDDPNNDQWTVLKFPAEAIEPNEYDHRRPGEWLWPERYPESYYLSAKAKSDYDWMSVYQQDPHNDKYSWFNPDFKHTVLPGELGAESFDDVNLDKFAFYGALDLSKGAQDFAGLISIMVLEDNRWLVWDCDLEVDTPTQSVEKILDRHAEYNFRLLRIEGNTLEVSQKAWQEGRISTFETIMRQKQKERGIVIPYDIIWNTENKLNRIRSLQPYYVNGQLCFRSDWPKKYKRLLDQFRTAHDPKAHNDGPDSVEICISGILNDSRDKRTVCRPGSVTKSSVWRS
ncbi:MAG: terminase family protein [Methanothrix sp.]